MGQHVKTRSTCRCCSSENIERMVELNPVPIISPNVSVSQHEGKQDLVQALAPLDIYLCRNCGLNQLIHVVDPSLIYKNYLYETNISLNLNKHFKGLQEEASKSLELQPGDGVVEFGSNDGTMLACFKEVGMRVQGVDPASKAAEAARKAGIPTITDFFSRQLAQQIRKDFGPAKLIVSNNTMANIDNLDDIFLGVRDLLSSDGVFIFETQYALDVWQKTLLDVIYHEHITYFSVQPLVKSLAAYGLELIRAERISPKGGSIRFWIQKLDGPRQVDQSVAELLYLENEAGLYGRKLYQQFSDKVASLNGQIQSLIKEVNENSGKVAVYGTSVGCAALIHQFELQDQLHCLFDDNPTKSNIEGPGYVLPVYGPDEVRSINPQIVLVLAWRYADVIAKKHAPYFAAGGQFFVPLPEGRFINGI